MKRKKSAQEGKSELPRASRRRIGRLGGHALSECRLCEGDADGDISYCVYYPHTHEKSDAAERFNAFCENIAHRFFLFARREAQKTRTRFCAVLHLQITAGETDFFKLRFTSYFGDPMRPRYARDKTLYVSFSDFSFHPARGLTKRVENSIL